MTEEDYDMIRWEFRGEKELKRFNERGKCVRKTYRSTNTYPVLYKFEDHRRWTVRTQERTCIEIKYRTGYNNAAKFEKKDLYRQRIIVKDKWKKSQSA